MNYVSFVQTFLFSLIFNRDILKLCIIKESCLDSEKKFPALTVFLINSTVMIVSKIRQRDTATCSKCIQIVNSLVAAGIYFFVPEGI